MVEAIVLGASAGALEALSTLLPSLPATYRVPLLVVVHLPPDRKSVLAELLQSRSALRVVEAEDKEPIVRGSVYVAPPDYHVLVEMDRSISLSTEEAVRFSRPSIDVLFQSAADVYRQELIGIVLTGANSDGAIGLRAVCDGGGIGIVQSPSSAEAAAMPLAAAALCPEAAVLQLTEIVDYLLTL